MSILEKIVKTEKEVQSNIKKAHEKANKLVSNAREKSLNEAEEIRVKTNQRLKEINDDFLKEQEQVKNVLKEEISKQHDKTYKLVNAKTKDIVDEMFNEAIK